MGKFTFYNYAETTITDSPLLIGATTMNVDSALDMTTPASGYTLRGTLVNPSDYSDWEVVDITAISGTAFTITRAAEDAADHPAKEWPSGTLLRMQITAEMLSAFLAADFSLDLTNDALGTNAIDFQTGRAATDHAATGADAVAIGYDNLASGISAIAIGENNESAGNDTTAIGRDNNVSDVGAIAIGFSIYTEQGQATKSVSMGYNVYNSGEFAVVLNASNYWPGNGGWFPWAATTAYTTAHTRRLAGDPTYLLKCIVAGTSGGTEPTPAAEGEIIDGTVTWYAMDVNDATDYSTASAGAGISGTDTAGFGRATAQGKSAFASGFEAEAFGSGAIAVGHQAKAQRARNVALNGVASADTSAAIGAGSLANRESQVGLPRGAATSANRGFVAAIVQTTDGTATTFTDVEGGDYPFDIPADHTVAFHGIVVAQKTDQTANAMWTVEGVIKNVAGTTTLVYSDVDGTGKNDNSNGWTLALAADDTNDCLQMQLTAAATVNATASLHFVEQASAAFTS